MGHMWQFFQMLSESNIKSSHRTSDVLSLQLLRFLYSCVPTSIQPARSNLCNRKAGDKKLYVDLGAFLLKRVSTTLNSMFLRYIRYVLFFFRMLNNTKLNEKEFKQSRSRRLRTGKGKQVPNWNQEKSICYIVIFREVLFLFRMPSNAVLDKNQINSLEALGGVRTKQR